MALQSANILRDPIAFRTFKAASIPLLSSLNSWRIARQEERATREAVYALKQKLTTFSEEAWKKEASQMYQTLLKGVSTAHFATVKPLLTEQAYQCMHRGYLQAVRETGAQQGVEILSCNAELSGVRAVNEKSAGGAVSSSTDVAAVQITMLLHSHLRPYATKASKQALEAAAAAPSAGSALTASEAPVRWRPARDGATGLVYWVGEVPSTGAGAAAAKVQWEPPFPSQLLASQLAHPFRIESFGVLRSVDAADPTTVRVSHPVVFERWLRAGVPSIWRICAL